jgi:hypothetical protein
LSTVTYQYLARSTAEKKGIQLHTGGGRSDHPLFFAGFATGRVHADVR